MNEEIQQIQVTLAQLEAKVEKATKWTKLVNDPLFMELVSKDYLGDDAVRLTMNLKPKTEDNEVSNNLLLAKATFSRFVAQILDEGEQALYSIEENKAAEAEINSEVD